MCGIAGAFGKHRPDQARIDLTLRRMRKRGPDASGTWSFAAGTGQVTLLHTRLSIIDLDARANQPFVDGDLVVAFNGEIYNYREVRKELEARGHRFATESDTEVLVRAYREYGAACVDAFEGMWAFALFDRAKGELVLSRDRFGEKPLFWMWRGGTLYFASEIKCLVALSGEQLTVNDAQVRRYLVNGYKSLYKQPATFFQDVAELPAGTMAVLRTPGEPVARPYWQLSHRPQPMSRADAVSGVSRLLERAVNLRMRSDVPIAFCLSGGVDSCGLTSIAAKRLGARVHAFSIIDRDERYDETDNINATVAELGCTHHVTHTSTDGFFDRMARLVDYHDAPVATISYYVHSFLSEAIAAAGFKVAISGTGADELFTGYYDHYSFWLAQMHGRSDFPRLLAEWRAGYGSYVNNPLLQDPLAFATNPGLRGHIYLDRPTFNGLLVHPLEEDFFEAPYAEEHLRNRMLNELFHEVVPVILHEDDLNSMEYSIENRSPYLDRELAEFLYRVPAEHLIHDGFAKSLLRDALAGVIPDQVRLDKRKRGFNASIDSLLDRSDKNVVDRLLEPAPIMNYVRRDAVDRYVRGDMRDNSASKFLFSFVSAKLFLESALCSGSQHELRAA